MNSEHHVSLKRKVLLPLMVATVTVFAGLTFLVYQNRNRYVQSVMRARAENIAAAIQYGANSVRSPETLKRFVQAFQNESGIEFIVVVVGSPAHVLAGTRDDWQGVPVANLAEFGDPQNFAAVTTDSPTQINYTTQRYLLVKHAHFTADWLGNEKERDGAVAVSLDTSQFNAELARTFRRTLVVFSAAMALLALFAWHLLRRNVVVPLNSIAKSLDAGDTHIAAPEDAPRPIARMADSLNASMSKVRDAESQAQAASVAKGEFLARVSHEIRTPMNGVMGMMEALLNTPLTEEQSDYLRAAYASADSLLRLINDLLDCSKIEAGKMTIESIDFDLESLAHQIVQLWERRADEKGVTLSAYIDPSAPKWLRGDPMRLGQILGNLVSNALKFTPQGTVDIRIDVVDQQIDSVALRFSVADTGIGIEPEAKARLFTPFTQADGSTSRRFGGTGLGLAICHELVKLMGGGAIKLDSAVGRGSQFEFTLPFQRAAGRVPQSTTKSNAASLANTGKILVVDDNDTNRKVLVVMLRRLGLDCESACDGFEAINDVQTREFSLVLMDCHMPVMDGFEATQIIRRHEQQHGCKRVPIVAVTASAFAEDRERCAAVGMDDFLPKPITLAKVAEMVMRWRPQSQANTIVESPTANVATPTSNDGAAQDLFDRAQLDEVRMLMGDGFSGMIEQLQNNWLIAHGEMETAIAANDAERMRKAAHKFKGSLATLGANVAADAAKALEALGRRGTCDGAAALIATLAELYARSYAEMQALSAPESKLDEAHSLQRVVG